MENEILAHNARSLRKAAGLSVQQAAEALGCNRNHLYRIEAKESSPGTALLSKMAGLFGCTMENVISCREPKDVIRHIQAETFRRQARELEAKAKQTEAGKAVGQ